MTPKTPIILSLYSKIAADERVNVWHISLYTFILLLWQKNGYQNHLNVSRRQLMVGAHFRSKSTYHKCISQLKDLEYIAYMPTYDAYQRSSIEVLY